MTSQAAAGQSGGVHFARFCAYLCICIAILMYTRAAVAEAEGNANGGGECKRVYIHTHTMCTKKQQYSCIAIAASAETAEIRRKPLAFFLRPRDERDVYEHARHCIQ